MEISIFQFIAIIFLMGLMMIPFVRLYIKLTKQKNI